MGNRYVAVEQAGIRSALFLAKVKRLFERITIRRSEISFNHQAHDGQWKIVANTELQIRRFAFVYFGIRRMDAADNASRCQPRESHSKYNDRRQSSRNRPSKRTKERSNQDACKRCYYEPTNRFFQPINKSIRPRAEVSVSNCDIRL